MRKNVSGLEWAVSTLSKRKKKKEKRKKKRMGC